MNWNTRYAGEGKTRKKVIKQLEDDYPEEDLAWIKDAEWSGPEKVDLDDIDSSHRKTWAAYHEPEKVKTRVERIKNKDIKPILLVKTPKNDKYIIVDGHHRFLAYEKLDKRPVCWVGHVDRETGPWDTFHNEQNAKEVADK